jgi:hypothetical protein
MTMKNADLEKQKAKKIGDTGSARGGGGMASSKREQALARKRELLGKGLKSKQ